MIKWISKIIVFLILYHAALFKMETSGFEFTAIFILVLIYVEIFFKE